MEKEKNRSEISLKNKWNLEALVKDETEFNKLLKELKKATKKLITYKGIILKDSETLYAFLKTNEKVERLITKLYVYAHMKNDTDSSNNDNQKMKMQIEDISNEIIKQTSFIIPEILKTKYKDVKKLLNQKKELKKYKLYFEKIYRYQKHTLSDIEEELLAKMSFVLEPSKIIHYNLDNTDIKLGEIKDEKGGKVELTNSNYNKYMESDNRDVRIEAFTKMYTYFSNLKNTFASNLRHKVKENIFLSDIRKYESPLEESLYADDISIDVYKNLIKEIHNNMDLMHNYLELKRKVLKLDEIHMYDIYTNIIKGSSKNIPFEECKSMIFASLVPLGHQYLEDLKKAFDEKWIDIYPNKGKKSGAYSWGCYDSYPYVLLNYNGTFDAVSTTAHELGHAMHSYYSRTNQIYEYNDYPIFLAEIASTVNEILLNQYYYNLTQDKNEKINLLVDFLDKIRTTIYRQTMFAEFEMIIHDKEKQSISLTEKEISDTYYNLNKLYYGDKVVSDDFIRYEWARIPHFYSSFYVYKYATGLSCAIAIATRLLDNEPGIKEAYLKFLSSGGSDYPLNILKEMNIDVTSGDVVKKAIDYARQKLKKLEELV